MKIKNRSIHSSAIFYFALIALLGHTAYGSSDAEIADFDEADVANLEVPTAAHFATPGGERIVIEQGSYDVALDGLTLWLLPQDDRPAAQISVEELSHDEEMDNPDVIAYAGETEEDQDVLEIVVLLPGGQYFSAMGSISGISARGLLDRAKNRQAMRKQNRVNRQDNRAQRRETRREKGLLGSIPDNLENRRETLQENRANRQDTREKNRNDRRAQFGIGGNTIPAYRAGTRAFAGFDYSANSRATKNTYLLSYLSTLIYPDYLVEVDPNARQRGVCANADCRKRIEDLHGKLADGFNSGNKLFIKEYADLTQQLFVGKAEYTWLHGYENRAVINPDQSNLNYDPEAMVISTNDAVFVVFRGTDSLNGSGMMREWVSTNINAIPQKPDSKLPGMVHYGFWNSLKAPAKSYKLRTDPNYTEPPETFSRSGEFRVQLFDQIVAYGGRSKPVWITGHSLGGGHSQLFAAYLVQKGVSVQGVYVFESPQVGNRQFVQFLDRRLGNRLQRFDFKSDPVTKVPIRFPRAGARVFAQNVESVTFDAVESRGPLPPVSAAVVAGASLCFHYPHWALVAAYNQLTSADQQKMPSHLGTPWTKALTRSSKAGFFACNVGNIRLGNGQS